MAGASLDIQLQISNADEVKAAFDALQAKLADLTPVFQDIGESMRCPAEQRPDSWSSADKNRATAPVHPRCNGENAETSLRFLPASPHH